KIVSESAGQLLAIVGEELRVERSSRNGHVSHTAIEQVLGSQFRVYMNQHTISRLSLARMAGHCVAVVKMWMLIRINFDRVARIHREIQSPNPVNLPDHSQFAVCNFQFI